jgi:hypothetical protein
LDPILKEVEAVSGLQQISGKEDRLHAIGRFLLSLLSIIMRCTHPITCLLAVCDAVFGLAIFGVTITKTVLAEVHKKYIYDEYKDKFAAWRLLRAIDLSPVGGLNFNGIEILRSVEELGSYKRGLLPSRSTIQRASQEMYQLGQQHIPFSRQQCELGEVFQYDYERFVRFLLRSFSLHEITQQESVELCITMDGAELCDGLCHLTAGIKITDSRAVDPRNGSPLCVVNYGLMGHIFHTQSRNYCFAVKSLLGKDTKDAYRIFADFLKFFEKIMEEGLPESELRPAILPFIVLSSQDLSSMWKFLNTGSGARKNGNTHFCHVCACTGNTFVRYLVEENR